MTTVIEILEATDMAPRWIPFFYDSNSHFGLVESPAVLVGFAKAWMESSGRHLDAFLDALSDGPRKASDPRPPKFGFRAECRGPGTLRNHLVLCGIDLDWLHEATSAP